MVRYKQSGVRRSSAASNISGSSAVVVGRQRSGADTTSNTTTSAAAAAGGAAREPPAIRRKKRRMRPGKENVVGPDWVLYYMLRCVVLRWVVWLFWKSLLFSSNLFSSHHGLPNIVSFFYHNIVLRSYTPLRYTTLHYVLHYTFTIINFIFIIMIVMIVIRRKSAQGDSTISNQHRFVDSSSPLCSVGTRNSANAVTTCLQLASDGDFGLAGSGRSAFGGIVWRLQSMCDSWQARYHHAQGYAIGETNSGIYKRIK